MKILVVSDSHGFAGRLLQAVEQTQPEYVIHLGDGFGDMAKVRQLYPTLGIAQVPGNCDFAVWEPKEQVLFLEGVTLFLCHGHTRGVKSSLQGACYAAQEKNAQVLLYGHTHQPLYERWGTLDVFNPGSVGYDGRYGLLELHKGTVTCKLCRLE